MLKPAPVRHYLKTIDSLGFDSRHILDGTGISSESLRDPQFLVDLSQYRHIFENMSRLCDGLGLDIGLSTRIEDLGPLGYAARFSKTPRHSLETYWPHYGAMFGLMGRAVFASDHGSNTTLDIVSPALSESAYRFCVEEALARLLNMGRLIVGQKPAFEKIELAFAEPTYHARYERIFQCPVYFEARRTRVTIDRNWLEKPMRTNDEQLSSYYQHHLRKFQQQVESSTPIVSRLRDLLLNHIEVALPTLSEAAQELGLSERTLSRLLQHDGVRYRKLVEEFRIRQALLLIQSDRLSTKEIAYQVGFQDVNAFRRAFKNWTGQTVGRFHAEG